MMLSWNYANYLNTSDALTLYCDKVSEVFREGEASSGFDGIEAIELRLVGNRSSETAVQLSICGI
ncbi:MAG: hypothetical protein VB027_03035 [Gordonibacter sp.]|nr:hypothetical protein [Gordonibacter sp.]